MVELWLRKSPELARNRKILIPEGKEVIMMNVMDMFSIGKGGFSYGRCSQFGLQDGHGFG